MDVNIPKDMNMRRLRALLMLCLILTGPLYALDKQKGTINGFVYDVTNGETLIGANVYIDKLMIGSSTNLSGYYVIPDIPAGEYTLICDYIGYQTYSQKIKIELGKEIRINIMMYEEALIAETIVVEAESIRTVEKLFNQPISKVELSPMEIKKVPQIAETDLLRSLQTLPGIVPVSDFSSALYVRGGGADQNLYLIDGSDVYNPEHAFGLFSTFNTDAIKHVDLSKGGFGAQHGGRLSSIMNVTYLDGNREKFEGIASVSLLSAKATLQMPLGKIGSISGSFRRTYFDQTVARFIDDIPDYYFYDGNLKAFFDLDANNKITISFFRGRDNLDFIFNEDAEEKAGFQFNWGNMTGSIRWIKVFNPKFFANFWITASHFSSYFDMDGMDVNQENWITDLTFKGNFEYAHSNHMAFLFGFEQKNLHGVYQEQFPNGLVDVDAYRRHYVGYLQLAWTPNILWDIRAGLRYNYFESDRHYQNLEPRFSVKYRLTETVNLKAATGIYHQYLHRIPMAFISNIWTTSDQYQNESTAYHYILGFQKEIMQNFFLEAETYYKEYNSIYQFNQNFLTDIYAKDYTEEGATIYNDTQALFDHGDGNSIGFEILLKKEVGSITGWMGYSLAKTNTTFRGINQNKPFPPRHDRSSIINVVCNIDIKDFIAEIKSVQPKKSSSRWLLGINFVYTTGQPLTVPSSIYITNTMPDFQGAMGFGPGGYKSISIYPTNINSFRLPAYVRLDFSLTYTKHYSSWSLSPYLQIFNIGNRKNVWFIQYEDESTAEKIIQKVETVGMIPILPTIGVTARF